jgi:hypothetical protein
MGKLYVRERTDVGTGAGRPRFAIVAASGADVRIYQTHIRKAELEKLAADLGAEIVYLPRGEHAEEAGAEAESGRRHGRRHHGRHEG